MNPFEEWLQKLFAKLPENPAKKQQDNIFAEGIRQAVATIATLGPANPVATSAVDFLREAGASQKKIFSKSISDGFNSLSDDEKLSLALDMGGIVGSIENLGTKVIPSWLETSNFFKDKAALKEQIQELTRSFRHTMEGKAKERKVFHASKKLFPEATLDETRQGAGVGDFWQGTGAAYVAEAPGVNKYYRNVLGKQNAEEVIVLPSGKIVINPAEQLRSIHDAWLESELNNPSATFGPRFDAAMNAAKYWRRLTNTPEYSNISSVRDPAGILEDYRKQYVKFSRRLKTFDEANTGKLNEPQRDRRAEIKENMAFYLKKYNDASAASKRPILTSIPRSVSYEGSFFANPDELFNLNIPLRAQPAGEKITAALNELPVGPRVQEYADGMRVGDYLQAQQSQLRDTPSLASSTINEMIVSGQNPNNAWAGYRPEITDASPWQVMEALKGKGIVGNQYLDKGSMNAFMRQETPTNPTNNYVVTDPSRLRFTDLFAAAPFGMAMQTLQQEQEKKNAKASKPSKK